jgi:AraC family transcriptional activator of tynA and feaB
VKTIFTTEEVNARDRFSYWHEVACKRIVEHQSRPHSRQSFEATLQAGTIAELDLLTLDVSPFDFSRTKIQASNADYDKVIVCRPTAGQLHLDQDGRSAVLQPGHIALLDPQRPYTGGFHGNSRALLAKVPRAALEARMGPLHTVSARILNGAAHEDDFLSSLLGMLPRHVNGLDARLGGIVQEQVVDLLATTLSTALEKPGFAGSTNIVLTRLRLRAAVEAALPDPKASPSDIAARAGVSVRYANQVLARDNTSIMRLVLTRRLERCRAAFEDASQTRRTISDIAYCWGFSDMTHFARAFSRAFGALPRDYRRAAGAARTQAA